MNIIRNYILVLFICACSLGYCHENSSTNPFHPKDFMIVHREGYSMAYDGRTRNAFWVYERLTRESCEIKNADRKGMRFKSDETIPSVIRASVDDYRGSGFDLGHLCPFADCRSNKNAAAETFILSNICPQVPQFNQGHWMRLEMLLREMVYRYKALHIITIPLYLPLNGSVIYRTLGNNNVAVPTHFCKVIFAEKEQGIETLAYVLPNAVIPNEASLDSFKTTLEKVERLSGLLFSPPAKRVE